MMNYNGDSKKSAIRALEMGLEAAGMRLWNPEADLPLDVDLAKNALDQLWGLINEENMAIIGISIEKDKQNPGGYVVYAKTTENKIYHYAMYITSWGDVIADGI